LIARPPEAAKSDIAIVTAATPAFPNFTREMLGKAHDPGWVSLRIAGEQDMPAVLERPYKRFQNLRSRSKARRRLMKKRSIFNDM
jgi:hypothetical protein